MMDLSLLTLQRAALGAGKTTSLIASALRWVEEWQWLAYTGGQERGVVRYSARLKTLSLTAGDACRRCLLALPSVSLGDQLPRLETVPQNAYAI